MNNKITYNREGDYFIPDLSVKGTNSDYNIGLYGRLRLEYLKKKYKQGKVDILLHGYSHEYQLSENKWLAEMKWKSSSQLKEEIPKGKKHDKKTYTGPCGRSADRSGRSCRRGCLRDQ